MAAEVKRARAERANLPGVISQWLVLVPIAFEGKDGARALQVEQIAQESQLRPRAGERVKAAQSELLWREVQSEDYMLDFNQLAGAETAWSVAYAVSYLVSESDQSGLLMKVGSGDQDRVYLNGKLVHESLIAGPYAADQHVVAGVELRAGINVLVFKVVNETLGWQGSVRLTDAAGQPVKGIKVTLTP